MNSAMLTARMRKRVKVSTKFRREDYSWTPCSTLMRNAARRSGMSAEAYTCLFMVGLNEIINTTCRGKAVNIPSFGLFTPSFRKHRGVLLPRPRFIAHSAYRKQMRDECPHVPSIGRHTDQYRWKARIARVEMHAAPRIEHRMRVVRKAAKRKQITVEIGL